VEVQHVGARRLQRARDSDAREWAIKEFSVRSEAEMRHFFRQVKLLEKYSENHHSRVFPHALCEHE
jgi:hypothetical protein